VPELPEVETVRAGLEALVLGATIESVDVRRESCVRLLAGGAAEFAAALTGARIDYVARRGKFLWCGLGRSSTDPDEPVEALSAHLGMSGQFRVHRGADAPEPHSHCRARFTLRKDGETLTLDFLDQRTFGYLHTEGLVPTADKLPGGQGTLSATTPWSVAHIARDALDPHLDLAATSKALRRGTRGIKQVLLDQTVVSGIGNIYADEALWLARLHPSRPANAVTASQARTVLDAAQHVMREALAQGGTSFDALYVNVNGESGYFARSLHAYGRAGEPCDHCGGRITRETMGGRSTHWCPRCQRRWVPRPLRTG
jgi:formamidopyrimidine-DNA glycosylase